MDGAVPPISALLKSATAQAHQRAEHSEGARWLTTGELDRDEYVRFLMMLYRIYDTLEHALDQHASHPVLEPTYNPLLLFRTSNISSDVSHLLQTPESVWQSHHPTYLALLSDPPEPLTSYVARLQTTASTRPSLLLAHAYVRYLGDLSGGQYIRRRLASAYGLHDGFGLSVYDFRPMAGGDGSARTGTSGDLRRIKAWFREGMDVGVGEDPLLRQAILDEANLAFELTTDLFSVLRPPTRSRPRTPHHHHRLNHLTLQPPGAPRQCPFAHLSLLPINNNTPPSTLRHDHEGASNIPKPSGDVTGTAGMLRLFTFIQEKTM